MHVTVTMVYRYIPTYSEGSSPTLGCNLLATSTEEVPRNVHCNGWNITAKERIDTACAERN